MLTAADACILAEERLEEAKLLLQADRFSGAYYLAGYAIEIGLKAVIAKRFTADAIPDKSLVLSTYSHDLRALVTVAQLSTGLDQRQQSSEAFAGFWLTASQWSERSRYAITDDVKAREMVAAVADPDEGVFAWLKTCF